MMPSALRLGPSAMIGGIVLFGLGYLIVYVGFLVAILKYLPEINAEVLAEQLKSREATQEQTKTKA